MWRTPCGSGSRDFPERRASSLRRVRRVVVGLGPVRSAPGPAGEGSTNAAPIGVDEALTIAPGAGDAIWVASGTLESDGLGVEGTEVPAHPITSTHVAMSAMIRVLIAGSGGRSYQQ